MLGRALTYLTMYSTLGMVVCTQMLLSIVKKLTIFLQLRYSYGVKLLARADTVINQPEGNIEERTPLLDDNANLGSQTPSTGYESDCDNSIRPLKNLAPHTSVLPNFIHLAPNRRSTAFYNSFPNSPNDSRADLDRYDSTSTTDTEDDVEIVLPTQSRPNHGIHPSWHRIARVAATLNSFMTVPLWSALFSLLVACIQPLQHALLNHMRPLNNAITTAGKCSVPLTLVVLGAYFHTPDETTMSSSGSFMQYIRNMRHLFRTKVSSPTHHSQAHPTKPGETKTVILAVASRMIITPILLIPAMALATTYDRYDWQAVFQE